MKLPSQAYAFAESEAFPVIDSPDSAASAQASLPFLEQVRCAWLCGCATLHVTHSFWTEADGLFKDALTLVERWINGEVVDTEPAANEAAAAADYPAAYPAFFAASRASEDDTIDFYKELFFDDHNARDWIERIVHAVIREHRARRWTADVLWRSSRLGFRINRTADDISSEFAVALDILEEAGEPAWVAANGSPSANAQG